MPLFNLWLVIFLNILLPRSLCFRVLESPLRQAFQILDLRKRDSTPIYKSISKIFKQPRYKLPYPEAIFEISYFYRRPHAFYTLARELLPGQFKPTLSHYFIRLLHQKGLLLRNYTQVCSDKILIGKEYRYVGTTGGTVG